ncbi:hypothetical protein JCM8115_004011 [Rhodotorula mucilaginosa]
MSPPPPPSVASSWTRFEPVASTSRVPYSAHFPTAPTAIPMQARAAFSTSSPSRNSRSRAYLIHPMARQRLTNLTFLSAGLLSVLTVSLAMSGTFGEGAAPGCPARVRTGVALEEQERRSAAASAADDTDGDGGGGDGTGRRTRKWWESSKAKGRFLEDPVVVVPLTAQSPNAPATPRHDTATPRHDAAPGPGGEQAADANTTTTTRTPRAAEGQAIGGVAGLGRSGDWRSGWKGLRDPEERVV